MPVAGGQPVAVSASGQLGIRASSARFKEAIKPMDKASESILSLQPVTFRYKKNLDPTRLPQFGLLAEQVAEVNADLVIRDGQGKPFTVRYEEVNAMLLNEFLKEHRKVAEEARLNQKQEEAMDQLKSALTQERKEFETISARQEAQVKALAIELRNVSDQVKLQHSSPRVVANE